MRFLKQSTATEVKIGPFVDDGDGFTALTALTISQADVRLAKVDGDWAQKNESTAAAHEENGWYRCLLDTTDTNTCGPLMLAVAESGALPVWHEFHVLEEAIYDALFAASANAFTGAAGSTTLTALAANSITAAVIATGAIDADAIADNAIDAGAIAADAITAAKIADGAIDAATFAANSITASALAADAVTEIQSGLATAAALATVDGIVDDILVDTAEIGAAGAGLTNINLPNQTMDIVGNITGNLSGSVGSVTGAVGSVNAGVTLADGVTHGGTTAKLRLGSTTSTPALYATNSGGPAVKFEATGGDSHGLHAVGSGSGSGFAAQGSTTGYGAWLLGGASGSGLFCQSGASAGNGISVWGQADAALDIITTGTDKPGVEITGSGAGAGMLLTGGATGVSLDASDGITGSITGNLSGSVGSVTGNVGGIAGTINTLDQLDTAQDTQHGTTQTAIAAVQADLPQRITKNTALAAFPFFMVLSSDHVTGATGLTVTAQRSLDGAAFGNCANSVSEIGNGWYKIDLAAADLNGNTVALKFTAATADARNITIATQPT